MVREYFRWFIIRAVLVDRYNLIYKWEQYDCMELSSPNGIATLYKDNKIRRNYLALILKQFGIDLTRFVRDYDEMAQQMKESGQTG